MVVVAVVYIILCAEVRQIPHHDSSILRTIFLDTDLYYISLIINFLTFLIRNNQQVHIRIYIYYIIISVASYMFRPPIVAIFREVLYCIF
jgi:hypothetical protein